MLNNVINAITNINNKVNGFVWGIPMLVLIIGTGIYLTVRMGFFQVIRAKLVTNETFLAIFKKRSVTKTKEKKSISQFQALSTALAATIGTGNIAGVATAIAIGGPGAVFWMWVSAFFGMMTNYSENVLGIYFRKKNPKGEWSGGAMYYIEEGFKGKKGLKYIAKPLAVIFAIFCVLASFGIGNMTQINSISDAMQSNFSIPTIVTGIVLAIVVALVIVGGIKRIGQVTEKLVPFMAAFYIIGALAIFIMNYKNIPYVFGSIFKDAFNVGAIAGGVGGYVIKRAMTMGLKRGVFSNEAGLGSSVMVHSASDVKEPVIQGMWGIFEVFFDTMIVCTLTAFVLLSSATNAPPVSEAMNNVTVETQYFNIAQSEENDAALIDAEYNSKPAFVTDKSGNAKVYTENVSGDMYEISAYGNTYYLETLPESEKTENDYTYTNIMTVKGNQKIDDTTKQPVTDENGNPVLDSIKVSDVSGVSLVTYAFSNWFGSVAGKMLSVAVLLFAFSTVLGWSFYGSKSMEYLLGSKAVIVYKTIFVIAVVGGATMNLTLAWDIADTLNGMMAIPNLIGVLCLSGTVVAITRNYTKRKIKNTDPDCKPMLSAYPDIQKQQEDSLE